MGWAPEELEALKAYAAEGLSANQIAMRIPNKTRNAVVGRSFRDKLKLKGGKNGEHRKSKKFSPRPRAAAQSPVRIALPVEIRDLGGSDISLLEMTDNDCKFIYGDVGNGHKYCGQRVVEGYAFCPFHAELVYRPRDQR